MIYTEAQTLLRYNLGQKEYRLPESIVCIGDGAFRNNDAIVSLILHDGVSAIGDYAMRSCRSLSHVELPSSVTSFGIGVFTNCEALVSVHMPEGAAAIDHLMFRGCTELSEIEIPDSVQGISARAFETCGKLSSITISPAKIGLLPQQHRLTAVCTYMHKNPSESDPFINLFVPAHSDAVMRECLLRGDRAAFSYMIRNDLFTPASVNKSIELSRQMNCTDICAMLLSYQNSRFPAEETALQFEFL